MLTIIPGYEEHLQRREEAEATVIFEHLAAIQGEPSSLPPEPSSLAIEMIPTRWTDLMMWAVSMGEHKMAEVLWSRSNDPMRAALLASQLCRRLSTKPNLAAEGSRLEALANRYEDMASEIASPHSHRTRARVRLCQYPDARCSLMMPFVPT